MNRKKPYGWLLGLLPVVLVLYYLLPERKREFRTSHFTMIYSRGIGPAKIRELAITQEAAYARIPPAFHTAASRHLELNIYDTRWRYIKATGHWGASGSIEGVSRLHFSEQAWGRT